MAESRAREFFHRAARGTVAVALLIGLSGACSDDDPTSPVESLVSGPYPDWQSSMYVLPFPVGESHRVSQGNCFESGSHQGTLRHSYDLEMPFGSTVTAACAGVVSVMRVTQPAGSRGLTAWNWIQVDHGDGTVASYVHLVQDGALVAIGERVEPGIPIAITGATGDVGSFPHVHFDVHPCGNNLACTTLPATFRNTEPNPDGLIQNRLYTSLPF